MSDILRALRPFVSDERVEHMERVLANRTRNLTLVLEDIHDNNNIAACLRSSEAMGLQEVHVLTRREVFKPHHLITQGAHKWIEVYHHDDGDDCVRTLKSKKLRLAVGILDATAISFCDIDFSVPTALAFGNERDGLSDDLVRHADIKFQIPMYGFVQSLNISVSAAIGAFFAVQDRQRRLGYNGDLDTQDKEQILERWFYNSVDMADEILARAGLKPPSPKRDVVDW